jgi:hypothetical protein
MHQGIQCSLCKRYYNTWISTCSLNEVIRSLKGSPSWWFTGNRSSCTAVPNSPSLQLSMTSTYSGVMTYQMLHDVVATRDLAVQQQRRSSCCCVGVCSSSTKGLVLAPRLQQASGAAVGFSGRQRTNRYPRRRRRSRLPRTMEVVPDPIFTPITACMASLQSPHHAN